ncbi:MAG: hypothetical protein KUG81_05470, partial [Gammaproteobacteria bacterium]|nr:hypothetical protein [Gammaproteobacteria bacterium]
MIRLRRIALDTVLGLLVTVVLFGLFELVFWMTGVGTASQDSLSRGFDESASYFTPNPKVEGGWLPNIFDGETTERAIAPKGKAKRVILFGGSNTRSFQRGKLPEQLAEASKQLGEGEDEYEVINLGRSGFGSGRVKVIFEQALEVLEPDVVVIYSGHNELTEASFAIDIKASWSSEWMRSVGEMAR